jgi:hypothetical protein
MIISYSCNSGVYFTQVKRIVQNSVHTCLFKFAHLVSRLVKEEVILPLLCFVLIIRPPVLTLEQRVGVEWNSIWSVAVEFFSNSVVVTLDQQSLGQDVKISSGEYVDSSGAWLVSLSCV